MLSRWLSMGSSFCPSARPSVSRPSVRLYFRFRTITCVNINGFSQNLVCTLILQTSGTGMLMGSFCQFLTDLSSRDTSVFSFTDDNFSKYQ